MTLVDQPQLSLVCFAYNEVATLETVIREYEQLLNEMGLKCEMIIIDDGSTDGSSAVADKLASEIPHIRVIHHPRNLGLGYSYREGYEQFRGQWLSFTSTDRQIPCKVMKQFVPLIAEYDLVLGYLLPQDRTLWGLLLSKIERFLYHVLFGPLPKFQGNFLVRRDVIKSMELRSRGRGWMIQMEMIIRALGQGRRITSVLTECHPRKHGRSRANSMKSVVANLKQVILLYFHLRHESKSTPASA